MVDRGSFTNLMNDLTHVDERVRSNVAVDSMSPLPTNWQPDNWSVICGRGKDCYDHYGNRRFRILVELNLEKYAVAKTKIEKSLIVMGILDAIREGSELGGFVKKNQETGRWFEIGDYLAREKISQRFRSSLEAKHKKGEDGGLKGVLSQMEMSEKRRHSADASFDARLCYRQDKAKRRRRRSSYQGLSYRHSFESEYPETEERTPSATRASITAPPTGTRPLSSDYQSFGDGRD